MRFLLDRMAFVRLALLFLVTWVEGRARAQEDAASVVGVAPPAPAVSHAAERQLPQHTTDVAFGVGLGFRLVLAAAGGDDVKVASSLEASVVHRFGARGIVRGALEPMVNLNDGGTRAPLAMATALGGARVGVARWMLGVSGWGIGRDGQGGAVRGGGALAVGRLEVGRPLRAQLTLQGGGGWAWVAESDGDVVSLSNRMGFSGEGTIQLPIPTRRRDVLAMRLTSRWFGANSTLVGSAGLDVVVGHGPSTRRPAFVLGYRWTVIRRDERIDLHGFRFGAEWYGLGASRAALPSAVASDRSSRL